MGEITPSRYVVNAGWIDAPHIDAKTQKQMLDATPPWMRGARSQGLPSKGAGAIYPVDSHLFKVKPFAVPNDWPRGYGMDVGWKCTCAEFFAYDANSDTFYLYTEHYMGQEKPIVHAQGIKARGEWIPGWMDPAARGRGQDDGERLMTQYQQAGLKLLIADNSIDSGLIKIWQLLSFGKLKVFETCLYFLSEIEHYRRDENGKIIKKNDHAMDATRYFFNTATPKTMKLKPANVMLAERGMAFGSDASGY